MTTTVKIDPEVRNRVKALAQSEGTTLSGAIANLLDEHDRRRRFAAVAEAYATSDLHDYEAEIAEWDDTLTDGSGDA